jgi:superfamily II DNA/RNA helicase
MGFIPDIERIAKMIPFHRQTLFFSATMPPEIQKLADTFLQNPERIEVAKPASAAKTVTQRLLASHGIDWEKRAALRNLLREVDADIKNAIIFCNRKKDVADLFRSLERHGFEVGALHGDMDQRSRTTMLQNFRDGNLKILVASDVAARGLDIPDVSHVFNFDVPIHAEDYVHRIGRTGRAGRSGAAFTIVTKRDGRHLEAIEKLIGEKIEWHQGDLTQLPPSEATEEKGRSDRRSSRDRDRGPRKDATGHKTDTQKADTGAVIDIDSKRPEKPMAKTTAAAKKDVAPRPERTHERSYHDRPYPANDDNRRRHYRQQDDGPTPVGFGDDVPAFMLTSAAIK